MALAMTTTCYGNIWKFADMGECSSIGRAQNAVSHMVTNQFEPELHEGDDKLFRETDGARSVVLQSHAGLMEPTGDARDDWEEFQSEDSLGCARGVLWSLILEGTLVVAAAIYWILRLTL
jgi:hypothetical protein